MTVNLKVSVIDPSENFVPNARITLLSAENIIIQTALTDDWGDAKLKNISPGLYKVSVAATGFADTTAEINVSAKGDNLLIRLSVKGIREDVTVSQSVNEKKTDPRNLSTNILTAEQIAQLPDDPEELKQTLQNMAGPGATIFVNGFRGGKLPPKSQIREIRFRLNPFSPDSHEPDNFGVDVFTKPGIGGWRGSGGFAFRDESLNARNAFSQNRPSEQIRRLSFDLSGTLIPKRTSLSLSANYNNSFEAANVLAALLSGNFQANFRQPRQSLDFTSRLEHAVSPVKNLFAEFQRNTRNKINLGVGQFDLPERAYNTFQTENIARLSYTGQFLKKYYNEFRAQFIWNDEKTVSKSGAQTVQVLNAFTAGGSQINRRNRSLTGEFVDNVDFGFGRHSARVGFSFEFERFKAFDESNRAGTFVFSSLEEFRNQKPILYTQNIGSAKSAFNQYKFGWYIQDDWRAKSNLTISYGLRHEWQSTVNDLNTFAPRLNIIWSPFKSGGTTLRAGSGIFYDWLPASIYEQTLLHNGLGEREIVIINPNYPDPTNGNPTDNLPSSKIQMAENLKQPFVWKNLLFLEQQILPRLKLNVFYQQSRSWRQFRGRNINAPQGAGNARPNPQFGNVLQIESAARSESKSVGIGLGWMNFPNFAINADYQLGRNINETDSALTLPVDSSDPNGERGFAASDIRHRITLFGVFNLWKNFRLGTFTLAQSGTPYNITTGFDNNGDGIINDRPPGIKRNTGRGGWNISTNFRLSWGFGFGKPRKNSNAQINAKVTRVGEDSNDSTASSPASSFDDLKHRYNSEIYIQATNLFNRTNFSNYSGIQTSPFFRRAISAFPARQLETGIRFSF